VTSRNELETMPELPVDVNSARSKLRRSRIRSSDADPNSQGLRRGLVLGETHGADDPMRSSDQGYAHPKMVLDGIIAQLPPIPKKSKA